MTGAVHTPSTDIALREAAELPSTEMLGGAPVMVQAREFTLRRCLGRPATSAGIDA